MVFDVTPNDLFQMIGELYVEKQKAMEVIAERDIKILELQSQLSDNLERNGDEV